MVLNYQIKRDLCSQITDIYYKRCYNDLMEVLLEAANKNEVPIENDDDEGTRFKQLMKDKMSLGPVWDQRQYRKYKKLSGSWRLYFVRKSELEETLNKILSEEDRAILGKDAVASS